MWSLKTLQGTTQRNKKKQKINVSERTDGMGQSPEMGDGYTVTESLKIQLRTG